MKTRIQIGLIGLLFLLSANEMQAQAGQWTWMKGDTTIDNCSYANGQGTPSTNNNPGVGSNCN